MTVVAVLPALMVGILVCALCVAALRVTPQSDSQARMLAVLLFCGCPFLLLGGAATLVLGLFSGKYAEAIVGGGINVALGVICYVAARRHNRLSKRA